MRFDASLQRLQSAVKELEKASKQASKRKGTIAGQQDLFGPSAAPVMADNDNVDVDALKHQLDKAITTVESLLKESA